MSNDFEFEDDFEITTISTEEAKKFKLTEIPKGNLVEVSNQREDGVYYIEFEGSFGWKDEVFRAYVSLDWYRKYWDNPLGLAFHMDLMKRLVEFRKDEYKDVSEISFNDEGDWCHLTFEINIPFDTQYLHAALEYAKNVMKWIDDIVNNAQIRTSELITSISAGYSKAKLITFPELIEKLKVETDIQEKGKLLEEFSSRFFSMIKGFEIIERKRTRTEEIDLVIINKSNEAFWKNESKLILVECKNWSVSKAGKNEYVAFREKLENRKGRAKVGFFISMVGYKKTFHDEDLRNSKSDTLIIPLEVKDMIEMVEKGSNISAEMIKFYANASSK